MRSRRGMRGRACVRPSPKFYLVETLRKRGHFDENEDCSTGEHGITMTTHHSIDNVKNNPSFGNNDNPFKETSLIDMSESHQQQQQLLPDDHRKVANIIVPSAPLIYDDSTLYSNTNDNNNNNSENSIAGGREVS
ncbi:unnamed protein product [Anisakis simplex]|uniref:Myb domain-containing protein n=1 Tax=Anisakis simplex TaxID=6269 RepID=A0A0M3IY71_ANISI|nr:unnamed protein product [Anisakis simplex]